MRTELNDAPAADLTLKVQMFIATQNLPSMNAARGCCRVANLEVKQEQISSLVELGRYELQEEFVVIEMGSNGGGMDYTL
jgi:hypothetical protein|uniref:Uncharacterized protein n=1 Tax=Bionectria ochroleuca TaxID=29856 RepID=A0A0B7KB31_BIOOC